jgi:glycosyltransferase involved in cell wall biosynthesis
MRLLFCCEYYYPSRGGVQEVMRQIAERMTVAGHDVTVATGYLRERRVTSHNGVAIRDFKAAGNAVRGMVGEVEQYRKFVRDFDGDAILIKAAQQWTFDALWPVLDQIKARKVFIPCGFSSFHEPAYQPYFSKLPGVLAKFDHLIFYAESYRDIDFARAHGLTRLTVLPNGASEAEFDIPTGADHRARLRIADDEFVFLTVGAPVALKGHREIAEAFALLDTGGRAATLILNASWPNAGPLWKMFGSKVSLVGDGLHLLRSEGWQGLIAGALRRSRRFLSESKAARGGSLGGRGKRSPSIHESIKNAQLQPNKRVLRTNFSRPDLVKAYEIADLFVFASNVEYSPLVLFEAAAAGTPFLSVPVGNAEEIARWTGGGTICPAARDAGGFTCVDPAVLAREMRRCMGDPDMLARLGATGKERWRRMFTWQSIAPQYEAILSGRSSSSELQEFLRGEIPEPAVHETVQSMISPSNIAASRR